MPASSGYLPIPSLGCHTNVAGIRFERSLVRKGEHEGVVEMHCHHANYFKRLPDFKDHRMKLVTERDPRVVLEMLEMVRTRIELAA